MPSLTLPLLLSWTRQAARGAEVRKPSCILLQRTNDYDVGLARGAASTCSWKQVLSVKHEAFVHMSTCVCMCTQCACVFVHVCIYKADTQTSRADFFFQISTSSGAISSES